MSRSLKSAALTKQLETEHGRADGLNRDLAAARQQLAQVEHEKGGGNRRASLIREDGDRRYRATRGRTQAGGGIGGEGDRGTACRGRLKAPALTKQLETEHGRADGLNRDLAAARAATWRKSNTRRRWKPTRVSHPRRR